jgi:hypothetical protein
MMPARRPSIFLPEMRVALQDNAGRSARAGIIHRQWRRCLLDARQGSRPATASAFTTGHRLPLGGPAHGPALQGRRKRQGRDSARNLGRKAKVSQPC